MSDDYYDSEEVYEIYNQQTTNQISELNQVIVALKTKIAFLEKRVDELQKENAALPVPRTVVQQILELEHQNRTLKKDLEYYKKHVPVQIIINKENREKPTRSGGISKSGNNKSVTVKKKNTII